MNITFKLLRLLLLMLCALGLPTSHVAAQDADTDAHGGSTRVKWEATGWFRLPQSGRRFWLVTPEGHPFFNPGINHLAAGWINEQRSDAALATKLTQQFKSWRFNTGGNPRLLGHMWTDTPLWNLKDAWRTIKKDWVSTLRAETVTQPNP